MWKQCQNLAVRCEFFGTTIYVFQLLLCRHTVVKPALKNLALSILRKSSDKNWRWLQVVPLFHFLTGLNSPYKTVPSNPNHEIKWIFWAELESTRKKQTHSRLLNLVSPHSIANLLICCNYSHSYTNALVELGDLMELDFVLAKVMLYLCPHNNLYLVLQRVDPIISTNFYIWYVKKSLGKEFISKAKDAEVGVIDCYNFLLCYAQINE